MTQAAAPVPAVRLAGYYFLFFAGLGVVLPFWAPYLEHLGFSPAEIGQLMGIFLVVRVFVPPLIGHLADRGGATLGLVRVGCIFTAAVFPAVFFGTSYAWMASIMALFAIGRASTMPLFEAITLGHLAGQTERYGKIRLWGSVGFIASVLALGPLIEARGDLWMLWACQILFAALALDSLAVPAPPSLGRKAREAPRFWPLLRKPEVASFMAVALLMQTSHGPYYAFFSILLEAHHYPATAIGALWALGVVAEMVLFLFADRLLTRFSLRSLVLAALALTSLRWVLTALFVEQWVVLAAAQLLHAASFGLFHAVMIAYVQKLFPGPLQARGQALYSSVGFGLGGAVGSIAAGYCWSALGPDGTYLAAAGVPLLGIAVVLAGLGRGDRRARAA